MRKTGDPRNFTRSYYMNGSDYILSGSCEETSVRVYNSHSGGIVTFLTWPLGEQANDSL